MLRRSQIYNKMQSCRWMTSRKFIKPTPSHIVILKILPFTGWLSRADSYRQRCVSYPLLPTLDWKDAVVWNMLYTCTLNLCLLLPATNKMQTTAHTDLHVYTFRVWSSEPLTTLSLRLKTAELTAFECPWNTLTEWMGGALKSHSRNVASREEVTRSSWVGWAQTWVNSWSWPA